MEKPSPQLGKYKNDKAVPIIGLAGGGNNVSME